MLAPWPSVKWTFSTSTCNQENQTREEVEGSNRLHAVGVVLMDVVVTAVYRGRAS